MNMERGGVQAAVLTDGKRPRLDGSELEEDRPDADDGRNSAPADTPTP